MEFGFGDFKGPNAHRWGHITGVEISFLLKENRLSERGTLTRHELFG